jgi:hypothetical protein
MEWIHLAQDGANGGSCEQDNESPGSIKRGNFLDQLSDYWFSKKDFAPWS